jgi:uncharacterized membrane protein
MEIAIAVVIGVLLIGGLIWALLQPSPETTMGKENRARRQAKKAHKKATAELADRNRNQGQNP